MREVGLKVHIINKLTTEFFWGLEKKKNKNKTKRPSPVAKSMPGNGKKKKKKEKVSKFLGWLHCDEISVMANFADLHIMERVGNEEEEEEEDITLVNAGLEEIKVSVNPF